MIQIVNKYKHEPTQHDIYIGRGSPLGNPYTSIFDRKTRAQYVCDSREESIVKYEEWLQKKIKDKDSSVCNELNRIYKSALTSWVNLVCFCHPKPCHGDVIKRIIDPYFEH